jgi:hypothetical protein
MDPNFKLSRDCTYNIGCRIHRVWDKNFARSTHYQSTGFTNVDYTNTNKISDPENNKFTRQILCQLANHEIINKIMYQKALPARILEELDPSDYNGKGFCLGLNKNMGEKICIRIRIGSVFLPYDSIIATCIHELVHMDVSDHNDKFYAREAELREIYNNSTNLIKSDGIYQV